MLNFLFMKSPNFLELLYQYSIKDEPITGPVLATALFFGFFVSFISIFSPALAFIAFCGFCILGFAVRLDLALYILVAISFFIGIEFNFGSYESFRSIPVLGSLNAPIVDFWAILIMISVAVAFFLSFIRLRWRTIVELFPGGWWYGGFLFFALISTYFAFEHNIGPALKYWFRPMLFVYIAYVLLPYHIIQSRKMLNNILLIWFGVGIGIALFGLSSAVLGQSGPDFRLMPYYIFGMAPLGYNHNLLAEPLVAILPITAYFFAKSRDDIAKRLCVFATILLASVAMLTLSRAAWLGMMAQATFFVYWYRDAVLKVAKKLSGELFLFGIIGFIGLVGYMGYFLTSNTVSSSTDSRVAATDVAFFYAIKSPLIGYGPGMLIPIFEQTAIFTLEFGQPLEGHGFIQKIMLEEGLIGLVLFCGFFGYVLKNLWDAIHTDSANKELYQAMFAMVLGMLVFELFNTSYFNSNLWLPVGIALAAVHLHKKHRYI